MPLNSWIPELRSTEKESSGFVFSDFGVVYPSDVRRFTDIILS